MNEDRDSAKGILYIVATPIGNLEDVTYRAVRILKEVHLIAAEDTRRTAKLLRAYAIETPVTSLYDQNERRKSMYLINKLKTGLNVAYVSDAGTPGISDPGYELVRQAILHDIRIIPVPGVSAVITALSVSGLPTDAFVFYGFLPSRARQRKTFLTSIEDEEKTLVFYESPKRLVSTLQDMENVFGDRNSVVLRELTKVFEEIFRGTISHVIGALEGRVIRGEVTLIVAGRDKITTGYPDAEIRDRLEKLLKETKLSRRDVIGKLAQELEISRTRIYRVANLLFP
jgi:16S rRNA (cytidine1402-2'-O)-methyltransferase